jgi:hypothetical protein
MKARLLCCEIAIGGPAKGARTAISHLFMIYNMEVDATHVQLPIRDGLVWCILHDTAREGGTEPSAVDPSHKLYVQDIHPEGKPKTPVEGSAITVMGRTVTVLAGITPSL